MPRRIHEIEKYNYAFDARAGGPGRLQLWGRRGNLAEVRFVDDQSLVPDPVVAADLERADLWLKRSALRGLVPMLRSQGRVGIVIEDDGDVFIRPIHGLTDSVVTCASCGGDLLAAKQRGIEEAMRRLVEFCGADVPPEISPITFHLDGDDRCGPYASGATGSFGLDASGLGHACLWDVEKENRALPFTPENAETIEDQLLVVHEAMHGWFRGRQQRYRVQEPFCKLVSFVVSEFPGGPEYCFWFADKADDHADALMKHLCAIGMTTQKAAETLQRLAESAAESGSALSDAEFAALVSEVLGVDAVPAFQAAGILP